MTGPADTAAQLRRGILLMVLAVFLFAMMDALIKGVSGTYGTMQIVFFRSLFALIPLGVLVARVGGWRSLRTRRPGGHVLRSMIGAGAMACFFYAFSVLPFAEVYAISFAAPLFVTGLSVPLLGESVGWRRWTAVVVGFVGVLIMLRPGVGVLDPAALVCLLGAVFYALAIIFVRRLSRTETNAAIILYFTLTCTAIGGVLMLPDWVTPAGPGDWAVLVAIGVLGGLAQIALTEAFRTAPVAVLAPFEYTAMVWAVVLGYTVFGELPTAPVMLGALVVIGSGLYILHRETRRPVPAVAAGAPGAD